MSVSQWVFSFVSILSVLSASSAFATPQFASEYRCVSQLTGLESNLLFEIDGESVIVSGSEEGMAANIPCLTAARQFGPYLAEFRCDTNSLFMKISGETSAGVQAGSSVLFAIQSDSNLRYVRKRFSNDKLQWFDVSLCAPWSH